MNIETRSGRIVLIALLTIALCFAGAAIAWAAIPQHSIRCMGCHTNPGGGELQSQYAGNEGCINCHSSSESSTTYELDLGGGMEQTVTVPVVVYTGASAPTSYLAGGNFWWVKEGLGADDTKGHNIFSGEDDDNLSSAPGVAYGSSCGDPAWDSCHDNLNRESYQAAYPGVSGKWGCTSCHGVYNFVAPAHMHHADDSNPVVGEVDDDSDAFFRFLMGHASGEGQGVCGIEDDDWEATTSSTDHNEYLGYSGNKNTAATMSLLGHTMTGFCGGCHGNFHLSSDSPTGGDWYRHPSGAVIKNEGEFASAFNATIDGTGVYDPVVPVARPDLSETWSGYSDVRLGTDLANCLSCHRAHGSPYPKMLRWDLNGCKTCHTKK